jgi:hypothetical protein
VRQFARARLLFCFKTLSLLDKAFVVQTFARRYFAPGSDHGSYENALDAVVQIGNNNLLKSMVRLQTLDILLLVVQVSSVSGASLLVLHFLLQFLWAFSGPRVLIRPSHADRRLANCVRLGHRSLYPLQD